MCILKISQVCCLQLFSGYTHIQIDVLHKLRCYEDSVEEPPQATGTTRKALEAMIFENIEQNNILCPKIIICSKLIRSISLAKLRKLSKIAKDIT